MTVKIAVPTGDSRQSVAALIESVGIAAEGYGPGSRVMRSEVREQGLVLRVFRERDIPVQVALGNYDIGICGDVWLAEFEARFPVREVVRLGSLPGPRTQVWLGAAPSSGLEPGSLPPGSAVPGARIASELPNLADLLALHMRLPGYRLMPVYGAAEAYPPEDAEFALLPAGRAQDVESLGLIPLHRLLDGGLALVANAAALGTRDLGAILSRLLPLLTSGRPGLVFPEAADGGDDGSP